MDKGSRKQFSISKVLSQLDPEERDYLENLEMMSFGEFLVQLNHMQSHGDMSQTTIDSETLADIYTKQGHYLRAVRIYQRLLHLNPNSEIEKKLRATRELQQRTTGENVAAEEQVLEKLDSLDIIQAKKDFLEDLLSKLRT